MVTGRIDHVVVDRQGEAIIGQRFIKRQHDLAGGDSRSVVDRVVGQVGDRNHATVVTVQDDRCQGRHVRQCAVQERCDARRQILYRNRQTVDSRSRLRRLRLQREQVELGRRDSRDEDIGDLRTLRIDKDIERHVRVRCRDVAGQIFRRQQDRSHTVLGQSQRRQDCRIIHVHGGGDFPLATRLIRLGRCFQLLGTIQRLGRRLSDQQVGAVQDVVAVHIDIQANDRVGFGATKEGRRFIVGNPINQGRRNRRVAAVAVGVQAIGSVGSQAEHDRRRRAVNHDFEHLATLTESGLQRSCRIDHLNFCGQEVTSLIQFGSDRHGEAVETRFNLRRETEWLTNVRVHVIAGCLRIVAFIKDRDREARLAGLQQSGPERNRDGSITQRCARRVVARQIVQQQAVIQPQEDRRRVVVGVVVELRTTGVAIEVALRRVGRSVDRVIGQFQSERNGRRQVDRGHVVGVDRIVSTFDLEVIDLALDGRDSSAFVVVVVIGSVEVRDRRTTGIEHVDIQITVTGQAGSPAGDRCDLLKHNLEVDRTTDERFDAVPIAISRQTEGTWTWIDVWIQVHRGVGTQVRCVVAVVVVLIRIMLEYDQAVGQAGRLDIRRCSRGQRIGDHLDEFDATEDVQERLDVGWTDFDRAGGDLRVLTQDGKIRQRCATCFVDHGQTIRSRVVATLDCHPQAGTSIIEQFIGDRQANRVGTFTGNDLGLFDVGDGVRVSTCRILDVRSELIRDDVFQRGRIGLLDLDLVSARGAWDQNGVEVGTTVVGILSATADHGVFTGVSEEEVVSGTARHDVIVGTTDEDRIGTENIIACVAFQRDVNHRFDSVGCFHVIVSSLTMKVHDVVTAASRADFDQCGGTFHRHHATLNGCIDVVVARGAMNFDVVVSSTRGDFDALHCRGRQIGALGNRIAKSIRAVAATERVDLVVDHDVVIAAKRVDVNRLNITGVQEDLASVEFKDRSRAVFQRLRWEDASRIVRGQSATVKLQNLIAVIGDEDQLVRVTGTTFHQVATVAGDPAEVIRSVAAEETVGSLSTFQNVIAVVAFQTVGDRATDQGIIASTTEQHQRCRRSGIDRVVCIAAGAEHVVVANARRDGDRDCDRRSGQVDIVVTGQRLNANRFDAGAHRNRAAIDIDVHAGHGDVVIARVTNHIQYVSKPTAIKRCCNSVVVVVQHIRRLRMIEGAVVPWGCRRDVDDVVASSACNCQVRVIDETGARFRYRRIRRYQIRFLG